MYRGFVVCFSFLLSGARCGAVFLALSSCGAPSALSVARPNGWGGGCTGVKSARSARTLLSFLRRLRLPPRCMACFGLEGSLFVFYFILFFHGSCLVSCRAI